MQPGVPTERNSHKRFPELWGCSAWRRRRRSGPLKLCIWRMTRCRFRAGPVYIAEVSPPAESVERISRLPNDPGKDSNEGRISSEWKGSADDHMLRRRACDRFILIGIDNVLLTRRSERLSPFII